MPNYSLNRRVAVTGSVVVFLFGAVFFLVGGFIHHNSTGLSGGVTTTGTVTASTTSTDSHGNAVYKPIIRFTDTSGQTHLITANTGNSRVPSIGSTQQVSYLPSQPSTARVLSGSSDAISWVLVIFGLVMLVAGGLHLLVLLAAAIFGVGAIISRHRNPSAASAFGIDYSHTQSPGIEPRFGDSSTYRATDEPHQN